MDVGEDVLMLPVSQGAESGDAVSVGIGVGVPADIIAVCAAAPKDQDIERMLFEVFALRPVLHDVEPSGGGGTVQRE